MRQLGITTILLLLGSLAAGAQGGREIPLPDTSGASFAIADSAARRGTPNDYDALVGLWTFRFQRRKADGSYDPAFAGHWSFEKKPGGMLIEDRWRRDDPGSPMGEGIYTYRTFDPRRQVWQMVGARSTGDAFALGLTWSDSAHRYAIQWYGSGIMRIRYLAITADRFLWRADWSEDGGATWLRDVSIMEARRVGR